MWGKKCRFGRKLTDFRPNVGVKSIDLGEKGNILIIDDNEAMLTVYGIR